MTQEQANLTRRASGNGYETALFSENPLFGSTTGFNDCVDTTHDFIDQKLLPSEFTPATVVDELTASEVAQVLQNIFTGTRKLTDLINTGYTAYRQFFDSRTTYPHHGNRVISHLKSYLTAQTDPVLTVTNLLDPHNPYYGSPPRQPLTHSREEDDALRNRRSNLIYLLTDDPIPEEIRDVFNDWESCFDVEQNIYTQFSREADRLLKRWHDEQTSRFENDLVIVLGDHGQLFGAEDEVGHYTSLHPHGIHVPLAVDPPAGWDSSEQTISEPVSIAGLGQALLEVVTGTVTDTSNFVTAVRNHSRGPTDGVLACVDGPTVEVPLLYATDRFDDERVTERCVRKVAHITREYVDVYQCHWNDNDINATSYRYTESTREPAPERDTPPAPNAIEEWVTNAPDLCNVSSHGAKPDSTRPEADDVRAHKGAERPEAVTERLKNLGYR